MRGVLASCVVVLAGCSAESGVLSFGEELIDFGEVIAGAKYSREISVFTRTPTPLRLNGTVASSPYFTLNFEPALTLEPHGSELLTLQYAPPAWATEPQEATIELWAGDHVLAKLRARGAPHKPECAVPTELDFGGVAVGDSATKLVEIENELPEASFAIIEHVSGEGFALPSGTFNVERGETLKLPVHFMPFDFFQRYEGTIAIRMSPLCERKLVRMRGTGFPGVLTGEEFVDWDIPLGTTEVQQVTLSNQGFAPVQLSNFQVLEGTTPSTVFRVTRSPLSVPGAERSGDQIIPGIATMELAFTAESTSLHQARLTIDTDVSSQPLISFNLTGRVAP